MKLFVIIYTETSTGYIQTKSCIHLLFVRNHNIMSYLSLLVLFLAVINLTLARNHNHQIHDENVRSNIVLISYQPPNPQKPIALDYGPSSGPNQQQRLRRRKLQRGPPRVNIPSVPGRSPERPSRPIHD
jgi:hypothetical protein